MKKFFLASFVVVASVAYVLWQSLGGQGIVASNTPSTPTTQPVSQPTTSVPQETTAPPPAPTPTPSPKPKGQYTDGTYTGNVADAFYGPLQVKVIISGGKITDVAFLQYPNDRSTSREINGQAMPLLRQEAIAAQNANVDIVTGATQSSEAFQQSLGNALSQAAS